MSIINTALLLYEGKKTLYKAFSFPLQFCMELNQPTLPNIRKWKGPRGCWKGVVSEKPSGELHKVH